MKRRGNVGGKDTRRFQAQNGPDALSAGKHAIAHRLMDRSWWRCLGRQQTIERGVHSQTIFLKEGGQFHRGGGLFRGAMHYRHDSLSRSGSNGSAVSFPSAFLRRISTRPSASSSCLWHSRESATPSSNNLMASSRESCGFSSRLTTSSRRASDFSKSGFFGGSGFFAGVEFTRRGLVSGGAYIWQRATRC